MGRKYTEPLQKVKAAIPTKDADLQIGTQQKDELEKQGYRMVGHHSAVKICGWTKNYMLNKGACYKYLFYGIRSHQCLQMTTSMFCASRCLFCWRGEKAPVSKDWYGPIDKPHEIVEQAIQEHLLLLKGFDGNKKAVKKLVKEKDTIKHVALSITGEPITYPLLNPILHEFHKRRISTFLVSNAQYPDKMEKIKNVTQLYLSIDAPNMKLFKRVDNPLYKDYQERILKSLDVLATRPYRTCIRLTMIKGLNMTDLEGYKELIERGIPDFIEIKGYMHIGKSKLILKYEQMPMMHEIKEFSEQMAEILPDYDVVSEHEPSRVVLLVRKDMKDKQYIDFGKFSDTVNAGKQAVAEEYGAKVIQKNN
jgi:tRNA wybutosine-synthesizing protein 1